MRTSTPASEVLTSVESFKAIGPEWDRLASVFTSPLLTHDWFFSAAATLHRDDRLAIFLRKSGERIVAAAPMVECRRMGLRRLEFIGSATLCEPSGFVYERPTDLRLVLGDVLERRLPVQIDRVCDPLLVAELTALHTDSVEVVRKSVAPIPWIRIAGSWDDYYATISPKWRSAHRRAAKKAGAAGRVGFEFHKPGPDQFGRLMGRFVDVEAQNWKGRRGTALRTNDSLHAFFQKYGMLASRRGILRLGVLRIGDDPVAGHFGVDYAGRHWVLKIGFDERFAACSPGILLMYKMLERAFDEKLDAFEFLGSNETWIRIWNHKTRKYYSRTIDQVPVRRLLARTFSLTEKVGGRIATRLAKAVRRT